MLSLFDVAASIFILLSIPCFLFFSYVIDHNAAEWVTDNTAVLFDKTAVLFDKTVVLLDQVSDKSAASILFSQDLVSNVSFNVFTFLLDNTLRIHIFSWMALALYAVVFRFEIVKENLALLTGQESVIVKALTAIYNLFADPSKLIQYVVLFVILNTFPSVLSGINAALIKQQKL